MSAGEWATAPGFMSIVNIPRSDGVVMTFDPPNIVFLDGGVRFRMADFDTDAPVFEVQGFDRKIVRYPMRPTPTDPKEDDRA